MRVWKKTGIVLLSGFLGMQILFGMTCAMAEESGYEQLRKENGGQLAVRHRFLRTTEQAVVFTFGGLSKRDPLEAILKHMKENQMHGTFFVTERELERNGENIDLIRSYGQDLGIGLTAVKDGGFSEYCAQIDRIREKLQERYGVDTRIVRQISGGIDEQPILEAVQAMDCMLIGQGLNVVQSKHKDAETADEIMSQIFGKWTTSLNRGEVVYIRTDYYSNDQIIPELMLRIKKDKVDNIAYRSAMDEPENNPANDSGYRIASVQDILDHKEKLWEYPDLATLPENMQPQYGCDTITRKNFQQRFLDCYIGAPLVLKGNRMLGFTDREMERADKTGLVKTVTDNTVFLTFDDWGQDDSINKLLYVLRKHKAKGTFFIITWNVKNNPNLLRAIAEEGQEIGSHTNMHKPMALENENEKLIPGMPIDEYREDVRAAYKVLAGTVGDMKIDGGRRYALTRFLRPPTLAISRDGCEEIMNAGYTYIVNGYGSTEDYGAVSLQSLVGIMNNIVHKTDGSVRKGSIVIMHMSSTASKTARALDILLTANDQLPDGDPRKFKTAFLGDYLKDGYSQMMKMPKEYR